MATDRHAKDPKEEGTAAPRIPPVATGPGDYIVTFAGLGGHSVKAGSEAEAVEIAKKELGVVSSEKEPDVTRVQS